MSSRRAVTNPGSVDPDAGFLCLSIYWQPNPSDPVPDMPGQKLSMSTFLPVDPEDECLCGSGRNYGNCCREKRYWHPICIDPDDEHFSLYASQNATIHHLNGAIVRERLGNDPRLHCVDTSSEGGFWIYWGDPPIKSIYGILCFGDIELKYDTTLFVTTLSHARMHTLLGLLKEHFGQTIEKARISYDPVNVSDKRTGKRIQLRIAPRPSLRRTQRR